jgi:molybdopterin-guanine dinucleotide biosynthesis protein A
MTAERLGAVVLAGGRSSRFGTDKMRALIDGRPLLDRSIAAVRSVASTVVVVLAPRATRDLPADIIVARDVQAFEGPLAGLAAGLAAMPPHIERVLVVGGDMPTLSTPVLALLLGALGPSGGIDHAAAAVLDEGGPMPMAVRASAAGLAARELLATGERRLRALPERLDAAVVPSVVWRALDPDGATLRDIDRPADLG